MPDKHLPIGGSTITRTFNCSKWIPMSVGLPRPAASDFANEGNMLHDVMEKLYNDLDLTPELLLAEGFNSHGKTLTREHLDEKIKPAIDTVEDLFDKYEIDNWECEPFVELIPGLAGGSIDLVGWNEDRTTLLLVDYKFGYNLVDAKEQLMFYAACYLNDHPNIMRADLRLVVATVQPHENEITESDGTDTGFFKTYEHGVVCTTHEIDPQEQADYTAEIYRVATHEPEGPNPGSWCKWCPAQSICPAKTGEALKALQYNPKNAETLSEALALSYKVSEWAKTVQKTAHEQMEHGVRLEGFKLVHKRPSRVWTDTDKVTDIIRRMRKLHLDDAVDVKLKSPAQMEKLFKSKSLNFDKVEDYISSVSSGTTLAPESDKRPEALPPVALANMLNKLS